MKNRFLILLIFGLISLPFVLARADNSSKIASIIEKINRFHRDHPKFQSKFTLKVNSRARTGILYYSLQNNNTSLKLFFGPEDIGNRDVNSFSYWVLVHKKLWIYLANQNLLIEQTIPEYFMSIGNLGEGLSHYLASYKEYTVKDIEKNKKVIHHITFSQPTKDTAFTNVSIDVNDDGLQLSSMATAHMKNKGNVIYSFSLHDLNLSPNFDDNRIFKVNPSGNVEILRNVLIKS